MTQEAASKATKGRVAKWPMAFKLLAREWRSGDLNLLFTALVLAVMTVALTKLLELPIGEAEVAVQLEKKRQIR